MSNKITYEPAKIYLHDPHRYFEEDYSGEGNTVVWSEDRISENDYEYVRASRILKNKGVIKEANEEELTEAIKYCVSTFKDLIDKQEDMPKEFVEVVNKHFWDLI